MDILIKERRMAERKVVEPHELIVFVSKDKDFNESQYGFIVNYGTDGMLIQMKENDGFLNRYELFYFRLYIHGNPVLTGMLKIMHFRMRNDGDSFIQYGTQLLTGSLGLLDRFVEFTGTSI